MVMFDNRQGRNAGRKDDMERFTVIDCGDAFTDMRRGIIIKDGTTGEEYRLYSDLEHEYCGEGHHGEWPQEGYTPGDDCECNAECYQRDFDDFVTYSLEDMREEVYARYTTHNPTKEQVEEYALENERPL